MIEQTESNKYMEDLNNTINQLDLINIYGTFQTMVAKLTLIFNYI